MMHSYLPILRCDDEHTISDMPHSLRRDVADQVLQLASVNRIQIYSDAFST